MPNHMQKPAVLRTSTPEYMQYPAAIQVSILTTNNPFLPFRSVFYLLACLRYTPSANQSDYIRPVPVTMDSRPDGLLIPDRIKHSAICRSASIWSYSPVLVPELTYFRELLLCSPPAGGDILLPILLFSLNLNPYGWFLRI
jgi:hypothetical protein